MKLMKIAWRNVFRHTRRTLITAAAIAVGLAAMIYMDTMMNGVDRMASRNIIDFETGALEVFKKGYYREEGFFPLDTIIDDAQSVMQRLAGVAGVKGAAPRVKFRCQVNNGVDELPVLGIGIDPALEPKVFKTRETVVRGTFLENDGDLLIGTDLARDLDIDTGSMVTVITQDRNGTYNAYDFIVSGLISTGHPLFDRSAAIMKISIAQELLAIPGSATEISVKVDDEDRLARVREEIAASAGNDYEVFSYRELNASIFEISGLKRSGTFLVAMIVVIIAAVGIVNTMLMAVMERIPEIGTLRAMGMGSGQIMRMFIYEGGIIGLFGSIIGCCLGLLFSLHLVHVGLDLSKRFENIDVIYPIKFFIRGEISFQTVLTIFLFGIIVSVLVTLWPVRKAVRLEPVDALRHA